MPFVIWAQGKGPHAGGTCTLGKTRVQGTLAQLVPPVPGSGNRENLSTPYTLAHCLTCPGAIDSTLRWLSLGRISQHIGVHSWCVSWSVIGRPTRKLNDTQKAGEWVPTVAHVDLSSTCFCFFPTCFCLFLHHLVKVLDPPGSGQAPPVLRGWALGSSFSACKPWVGGTKRVFCP